MRRFIKRDWVLLGLVLLAVSQAVVLSFRADFRLTADTPWFTVGDTLADLDLLDSEGDQSLCPVHSLRNAGELE